MSMLIQNRNEQMFACGGVENVFMQQEIEFIVQGILQIDQLQLQALEQELQARDQFSVNSYSLSGGQHQQQYPSFPQVPEESVASVSADTVDAPPGTLEATTRQAQTQQLEMKLSELIADQQGDQNARITKDDMSEQ